MEIDPATGGRWADNKPRCSQCKIILIGGVPPSSCRRQGCSFYQTEADDMHEQTLTGCTLVGEDYSVLDGGGR